MDTDFDESMDAFKKPTKNVEKKKDAIQKKMMLAKRANIKKKGNVRKKLKDSKQNTKPKKTKVFSENFSLENEANNNESSEKDYSLTSFISLRENTSSCCPTCGERFGYSELKAHTRICLRANFEVYKLPNKCRTEDAVIPGEPYFCPTCGTDLSLFTKAQRNTHANRCLDHSITEEKDTKSVSRSSPRKTTSGMAKEKLRCLICAKVLASHQGLKRHYVSCQRRHKFSTMTALVLNQPENDKKEDVNVELLAEIRRSENRSQNHDNMSSEGTSKTKIKKVRKTKTKKAVEKYDDEMLALTIALSKNEDVTKKKPKVKKKGKFALDEPAMLSMSPNSKQRELQQRREEISRPAQVADEDSIPSTPALPASSLSLPAGRANIRILSRPNDDEAGPSHRGIVHESPAQRGNTDSGHVSPVPPQPFMLPEQRDTMDSVPVIRSRQHPSMSHSDELQSPEVSSSNLISIPVSTSDHSDIQGTSEENFEMLAKQEEEVQRDSLESRPNVSRPSRWTMTTSNGTDSGTSSYRVRGLLTQFESKSAPTPVRNESKATSSNGTASISIKPEEISDAVVETTNDAEIDCTLKAMDAMENELEEPTQNSNFSQPMESPEDSNDREEVLTSSQFAKIVDNPKFSDAKILVGENQDIIHLHKSILLCRCPKLLDKLDRNDTLILKNFEKSDVLSLIHYIYSGSLNFISSEAKNSENFLSKIRQLMDQFCITLSDTEQLTFDALVDTKKISGVRSDDHIGSSKSDQLEPGSFQQSSTEPFLIEKDEDASFEEDLQPQNLTQEDPSISEEPVSRPSVDTDFDDLSRSDMDMFDLNSTPCRTDEITENSSMCDQKHSEALSDSVGLPNFHSQDSNASEEVFVSDLNDSFISFSQTDSVISNTSVSRGSPKKRKRKRTHDSPAQRRSKRKSAGQHRRHSKYGKCPCCQEEPIVAKPNLKERSRYMFLRKTIQKSIRKSALSKSRTPIKHNLKSKLVKAISPIKAKVEERPISPKLPRTSQKRKSSSSKQNLTKSSENRLTSAAQLSSNNSKNSPSKKNVLKLPRVTNSANRSMSSPSKSPSNTSKSSKTKGTFTKSPNATKSACHSASTSSESSSNTPKRQKLTPTEQPSKIQRRSIIDRRSSSCRHSPLSGDTVYVSERLPRFKLREHIRSRPGVANMGKSFNKASKPKKPQEKTPKPKLDNASDKKNRISMSQPVKSELSHTEKVKPEVDNDCVDAEISILPKLKKYKFKRLFLAGYASPNPNNPQSTPQRQNKENEIEHFSSDSEISGYDSDGDIVANICFDDSFEKGCLSTPKASTSFTEPSEMYLPPHHHVNFTTPQSNASWRFDNNFECYGPVPITPMPNYNNMPTPDVIKQATQFGLKKTLGKSKLRTKLQEAYLYKHLLAPANAVDSSDASEDEDIDLFSESPDRLHDDDLCVDTAKIQRRLTLELSRLSSSSAFHRENVETVYTFANLTPSVVQDLATKVVNEMHEDGTLLKALKDTKNETGSIKRGSRQDQRRCWDIVTPGSSGYDPKLNAILRLSEEYQTAITGPLVSCVVKNYISYKKSQFDCLPIICDRMQNELNHQRR